MAIRDFGRSVGLSLAMHGEEIEGATTSDVCDMKATDGQCFAVQLVTVRSGTSPSITGSIQESHDNITWSAVSGASFSAVTVGTNQQVISFTRAARYLRYSAAVSGTNPNILTSVLIGAQKKQV